MAYKKLKFWFDKALAEMLAEKLKAVAPGFPAATFCQRVDQQVAELELKARVEVIADELHLQLGKSYPENLETLLNILGPENEEETGMFTNFYWIMPIAKYVEKYGLDHFEQSMQAIEEITKRNTGEYTIRPYLEKYPKKTLAVMKTWAKNDNRHVRRLASEGLRPRLPWAPKLQQFIDDPRAIFPILHLLKDDDSKYVQKSVANCLNDVLKDHPALAQEFLEKWSVKASKNRKWIIKHALRNLVKKEDPRALALLQKML